MSHGLSPPSRILRTALESMSTYLIGSLALKYLSSEVILGFDQTKLIYVNLIYAMYTTISMIRMETRPPQIDFCFSLSRNWRRVYASRVMRSEPRIQLPIMVKTMHIY